MFITDPSIWLKDLFFKAGLSYHLSSFLSAVTLVAGVIILAWLLNLIVKGVIIKTVTRIVRKTTYTWISILQEQKVFTRLSHIAPALIIWTIAGWAFKSHPFWMIFIQKVAYIYMILAGTIVLISFIEAWHKIYKTLPISQDRHIKGYVQLVKIFTIILAILFMVSVIFRKDITTILAGLGAVTAVIILIFKDTLLGLVASIQLSADKMISVGDWITMPSHGIDGNVTDITLNTVKVRNFDKTIVTISTYSLASQPFQNWKGMEESGVRRIRRAIFIDMRSIRFLDVELRKKFSVYPILKEYIETTENLNSVTKPTDSEIPFFNYSRLTNLGLFRYYAETYLRQHPQIDPEQSLIVRHRDPEGNGLPLQVTVFTKNSEMVPYEKIQSDIFEHILSIIGEFGLKIYQQPSGDDLLNMKKNN